MRKIFYVIASIRRQLFVSVPVCTKRQAEDAEGIRVGDQFLNDQNVVFASFDERAVFTDAVADRLVLFLLGFADRLDRAELLADLGLDQAGIAAACRDMAERIKLPDAGLME